MPEEQRPAAEQPNKSGETSFDHSDTDWGADWESAFKAEDDMFLSDSGEDFFLEEEKTKGVGQEATAALEKELEGAAADEEGAERRTALPALSLAPLLGLLAKIAALPLALFALARPLFQRFKELSVRNQIFVISGAAVILLVGTISLWLVAKPVPQLSAPSPPLAPPGSPVPGELSEEARAILADIPATAEKIRKKWPLSAFYIPVRDDKGSAPLTFVQIDITLNTLLGEQEELPPDKVTFIRDVIYQFFINRTLAELRHYQLARGDLHRDLRTWIEKQWPEAPIESITFNRYQLS